MTEHGLIIAGIAVLATGTYLLRLAGFRLGSRLTLSPGANALLGDAATTLLLAVAAVATLYEGGGFAVAAFLAWRKKPLIVVILVAAAVSAGLRQIGLK
jgi:uncharacterized membrane protein